MLSVEELISRTYEERMEDVLMELPIRSFEWTNYNASDPGITILENLTAFSALQGAEIVSLSYRARWRALSLPRESVHAFFFPGMIFREPWCFLPVRVSVWGIFALKQTVN